MLLGFAGRYRAALRTALAALVAAALAAALLATPTARVAGRASLRLGTLPPNSQVTSASAQGRDAASVAGPSAARRAAFTESPLVQSNPNDATFSDNGSDPHGIGVMTGRPKVYLIFTGSQWGARSTDIKGDVTLSGDPLGAAPYLQEFFKGLGTNNDQWSGLLTQYCQGVPRSTEFCPDSNTQHVGYPNGGDALAGVWVQENHGPLPPKVKKSIFAKVALDAALHFGNNTWLKNRNAVYIVLTPPGTNPDDYLHKNWCATHTWDGGLDLFTDGGPTYSTSFDPVSLILLPYVFEKPKCFQNAVNPGSAGVLDGFSILASHEYAETLTDPFPPAALPVQGGWWGPGLLNELGDKCQGKQSYPTPAPQNLRLATGNFPVQAIWSNNAHGCVFVHPVVQGGGIVNGGFDSGGTGLFSGSTYGWNTTGAASVPVSSGRTDVFALELGSTSPTDGLSTASQWFTAPPGVNTVSFWYNISCPDPGYDWASATLVDTGFHRTTEMLPATCEQNSGWKRAVAPVIPGHAYTLTLRNFDDNHAGDPTHTLFDDVRLQVTQNGIFNGGFESGDLRGWTATGTAGVAAGLSPHSGTFAVRLGSSSATNGDSTIKQVFVAPPSSSVLSFFYWSVCPDPGWDWGSATLTDWTTGKTTMPMLRTCQLNSGWTPVFANITPGDLYTLTLTNHDDNNPKDPTYTQFDDVSTASLTFG